MVLPAQACSDAFNLGLRLCGKKRQTGLHRDKCAVGIVDCTINKAGNQAAK